MEDAVRELAATAVVLAAIAVIALAAAFFLTKPSGEMEVSIQSENITSASGPALAAGEEYAYELQIAGNSTEVTVKIEGMDSAWGAGCVRAVRNVSGMPALAACYFEANGSAAYFEIEHDGVWARMPPETYAADPVMIFYEPWMLSLRDGWSGSLNKTSRLPPGVVEVRSYASRQASYYRFLRRESYSGRPALVAEAVSRELEISGGVETVISETRRTVWVDEEKRVVLGETYEIGGVVAKKTLVRAPFRISIP